MALSLNRLKVGCVVVDEWYSQNKGCRGDHGIESPTSRALLPGFCQLVGVTRRRWGIGKQSHDLTGHNGCGPIQRPHATELVEVIDSRDFDAVPPFSHGPTPREAIATNSLEDGHRWNVNRIVRSVDVQPALDLRVAASVEPTFGAGIKEKRARWRIDHGLLFGDRLEDYAV
jgi:hypothetical protein